MAEKWVKTIFADHGVNRKVVDNVENYLNMKCQPNKHHKRIAQLMAEKRKEEYSKVLAYIRRRVSFNLMKSVLTALRGVRGKRKEQHRVDPISSVEFGLIPEGKDV